MRILSLALAVALLFSPTVAGAQTVIPLKGADPHLYLNIQEAREGSAAAPGQATRRLLVTKGQIPLAEDRFLELIEGSMSAPAFMEKVRFRRANAAFWNSLSLALLVGAPGVGGAMVGYGYGRVTLDSGEKEFRDENVGRAGIAVAAAGVLLGALAAGPYQQSFVRDPFGEPGRLFSYEEAQEAIDAYNRLIDSKK
ncbi:MAG: hypothetical protein FJZ01_11955 [Candidatus Sericytochromatia bacterium]|nr:hypothetical protein [Candidatus Tanganyikabacteria bacterium]